MADEKRKKTRIVRWQGVVSGAPRILRVVIAIVLGVAGVAFTFTQLGFTDVTLPDGRVGYVVALLQVVALGALLLGTLAGAGLGLATGSVLFIHAQVMPLDHYELAFVTPLTSVIMFGISGLILGILFAFALRNDPQRIKRAAYIAIVCLLVSLLYTFGFAISVFASLIVSMVEAFSAEVSEPVIRQMASMTVMHLGDMGVQFWGTGLLMAFLCVVADIIARKAQAYEGTLGLRTVFGSWLAIVVVLAFFVLSATNFASATQDELRDATDSMQAKTDYLANQIETSNQRLASVMSFFDVAGVEIEQLDEGALGNLMNYFSDSQLLSGYTPEKDGILILAFEGYIYECDDSRFKPGESIEDVLGVDIELAIEESASTGKLQRVVMSNQTSDVQTVQQDNAQSQIAYLLAKKIPYAWGDKDEVLNDYVILIQTSDQVFSMRASIMSSMTIAALVLLLSMFAIVFFLLDRVVATRIDEENKALALITEGNLDVRAEAGGTREFESLSEGINTTVDTLKGWIAEAESRMDAELAAARAIQESALPRTFPPFPDIQRFDVYASMNAAKQVGGDFYDFFLIGDNCTPEAGKLAFVIADVSGKGVPAALFMMKAMALLRDYVSSGMELGEAVSEVNGQLIDGNDEGMFVTAWVGVLNYASGVVNYVNAGHNPPLLWNREEGWHWLRKKSGPVLGLFEMQYRAQALECKPGDTFILYTDGVTEAFDVNGKLYGEERLLAVAEEGYRLHPRELLEAVRADVALHAQGAEQSDDITILTLEVGVPPEITATLEVPAKVEELDRVNAFLHSELKQRLCPQRVQNQLDIAVEELFVNVCHYAYPQATPENPGTVRIQRTYTAEPASITVDIIDDGVSYNPLAKPDAVTPGNIEDVPIGGLGILMAKRCADEMRYERIDDSNVVTIVKKW